MPPEVPYYPSKCAINVKAGWRDGSTFAAVILTGIML